MLIYLFFGLTFMSRLYRTLYQKPRHNTSAHILNYAELFQLHVNWFENDFLFIFVDDKFELEVTDRVISWTGKQKKKRQEVGYSATLCSYVHLSLSVSIYLSFCHSLSRSLSISLSLSLSLFLSLSISLSVSLSLSVISTHIFCSHWRIHLFSYSRSLSFR